MVLRRFKQLSHSERGSQMVETCVLSCCLMLGLLVGLVDSRNGVGMVFVNATVGVANGDVETGELEIVYGGSTEGTRRMLGQSSSSSGGGGCPKEGCRYEQGDEQGY